MLANKPGLKVRNKSWSTILVCKTNRDRTPESDDLLNNHSYFSPDHSSTINQAEVSILHDLIIQ